jgi:alpha/beta superfamily hydrolase
MKIRDVRLECDRVELSGEMYIPDIVPAPSVLVCHGLDIRGYHRVRIYREFAEAICREGFVALIFDFRGVGKSDGEFDYGVGEQQDVRCMLNYLTTTPEVVADKTFVAGHSLGGAVSLYALQNDTRVRGLVLWSTPKDHYYNVKKFIRRTRGRLGLFLFQVFAVLDRVVDISRIFKLQVYGINLRPRYVREKLMRLNEREAIAKLHNLPVLIIVGEKDKIVGQDEAEAIFSAANEPKKLLIVKSADHNFEGKENEVIDETIGWIKKLI